jgi:hypothetical protein
MGLDVQLRREGLSFRRRSPKLAAFVAQISPLD